MDRKVNQTEKMALWLSQFLYGGRYEAVYRVFGFNRSIKKGNEPSYITYADKPLQVQIEALYPNRPAKKVK